MLLREAAAVTGAQDGTVLLLTLVATSVVTGGQRCNTILMGGK